jgi:hypothetical protein
LSNAALDATIFAAIFFMYWIVKIIFYPNEAKATVLTFWGIVEFLRILLLVLYAWHNFKYGAENLDTNTYRSFMNFVSWMHFLNSLSVFESLRQFTALMVLVIKDMLTFLFFMTVFIVMFSCTFYYSENKVESEITVNSFLPFVVKQIDLIYAVWDTGDIDSSFAWVFFVISSLIMTLVMVNLLVAVIGDTYSELQDNLEAFDAYLINSMILDLEIYKAHTGECIRKHLVYVEYDTDIEINLNKGIS